MKKIVLIIEIIFAIIASITYVQAATATAELKASSTSVKKGDTFTVTLSATCSAGINGVIADYTYDTGKLELIEHKTADDKFMNLNVDSTSRIETAISSGSVTSYDIFILKFKVKDTVQVGETAAINIGPIIVDSDTDGEATVQAKSVSIQVANQASSGDNDSNTNTASNNTTTNNTGTNIATNTSGNNTSGTITNGNNNVTNTSGKSNTTSTNTPAKTTDKTTATSILPKTGFVAITGIALITVAILSIVTFKKLKKYNGIK